MSTTEKRGCGAPATRIVFRGKTKRLFLCPTCPYTGTGKVAPYETEDAMAPQERKAGTFYGEMMFCGNETGG